jgi:hypothetical protein
MLCCLEGLDAARPQQRLFLDGLRTVLYDVSTSAIPVEEAVPGVADAQVAMAGTKSSKADSPKQCSECLKVRYLGPHDEPAE